MGKISLSTAVLAAILIVAIAVSGVVSAGVTMMVASPEELVGPQGPQGEQGPAGPAGPAGATGATGPAGPAGATGATGPAGATGATGPAGANGAAWLSGSGAPDSGLGNDGDYYLDTATSDVYNKSSGTWTFATNIKGETGESGQQGPQGEQGIQGMQGEKGDTGATGEMGPPGTTVIEYATFDDVGDGVELSSTIQTLGQVTLTAPAEGIVIINLKAYAKTYGDSTAAVLGIGTTAGAFPNLDLEVAGTSSGTSTVETFRAMSCQAAVPVTEGSSYTFYAIGYQSYNAHSVKIFHGSMVAVYYVT
jgi:hypothetical protein